MAFAAAMNLCLAILSFLPLASHAAFPASEYRARLARVQQMMKADGFTALLLTMQTNHVYFTGINMEFWASPTRPYFLVVPDEGNITAVVPTIAGSLYEEQCSHVVGTLRTWSSPQPRDDGVSILHETLRGLVSAKSGLPVKIGAELGWEFSLRMPVSDLEQLKVALDGVAQLQDATPLLKRMRVQKSEAEIALQKEICQVQSQVMARIPEVVHAGMSEREVCRTARRELLGAGIDLIPYMSCRSDQGGYTDIVGGASDRKLREGDMLIIDTGSNVDGYFCDFNRNWYVGARNSIPKELLDVQDALYAAVEAGMQAARPGRNTADIFHAMSAQLPGPESSVGRAGHSVGLAITEWPSIISSKAGLNATLSDGMVFSIEPSLGFGDRGQFMVHEEVIVVRENGGELLSVRAPRTISVIGSPKEDL